jgi:hypothetical protein
MFYTHQPCGTLLMTVYKRKTNVKAPASFITVKEQLY